MKERLIQLLDLEQLSPSKFADIIGVQRSSISHVLSGRNKPSFDFLQKTLKAFPGLNASWLMLGEGTMYEQMGRNVSGNLFDAVPGSGNETISEISSGLEGSQNEVSAPVASRSVSAEDETPSQQSSNEENLRENVQKGAQDSGSAQPLSAGKKKIVQVMVIYEDDTFRAFSPSN